MKVLGTALASVAGQLSIVKLCKFLFKSYYFEYIRCWSFIVFASVFARQLICRIGCNGHLEGGEFTNVFRRQRQFCSGRAC